MELNVRNRYQAQWEMAHGEVAPHAAPSILQIGLSNRCNFHCVYCPDHFIGSPVAAQHLDADTLEDLLQYIPQLEIAAFHGVSEFFVEPNFFDIVGRCAAAGVQLSLNTNGSVLTPRHLDALGSYPAPLMVNFSLDATTAEVFRRIRGYDFDRVLRNVCRYVERFRQRTKHTWLSVSFVIMKSNVHEMAAFVRLGRMLGVNSIVFYRMHEYDGFNWTTTTADGEAFNYLSECTNEFPEDYNRNVAEALRVAKLYGLNVEMPALLEAPK